MNFTYFKNAFVHAIEQVKSTLPDDVSFDWRQHILPRIFPFLQWKNELRDPATRRADLMAGLLGAVIVLPQGVAFAMIAGLPPIYGLYTAMVTPIIAALFGSSRHLISGPTTAISIVVFGALSKLATEGTPDYIEQALLLTFLAGALQLAMGLGRLGRYVSFVSHTVVVGFTAGAAMLIITNQMKGVLGISIASKTSFLETWRQIIGNIFTINEAILAVSAVTLVSALFARKVAPKSPYMLTALAIGTCFAWIIGGPAAGIPFIGEMPRQLPSLSMPGFSPDNIRDLASDAFAIALLGLIEAVSIGKAIATKSGQPLNANQEFIGQGLSNMIGSFFSCYAGSGSFTRSGINYQSGARTPMAAIFGALFLMVFVLAFAPYASVLPIPALSGLILLVGWNLIDFDNIREIRAASQQDVIIFGATLFSTLFFELEFAIYIGVLLSLFFFLKRTSEPNIAELAPDAAHPRHAFINIARKKVPECPQLKIIRIDGALYFGAIDHIAASVRALRGGPEKYMLLLANGVNHVDYDGAEWLAQEAAFWQKKGGGLYIVRLKLVAQEVVQNGGYLDEIGREYFFTSKTDALTTIYDRLDKDICRACSHRIFLECANDPAIVGENVGWKTLFD